jgi:hypothetical protein
MALFFDAEWFDARLTERGLDRAALADAWGLERGEQHLVFASERAPTAAELAVFADVIKADLVEVTLRAGVAAREPAAADDDPGARIDSIEARLDAIDNWLAEFESGKKRA